MNLELTKRFRFEAHHRLPWHDGKCARDHGHSYVLEVSVRGQVQADSGHPESGMVMDFARVGAAVKPVIEDVLDHQSLNALVDNPTGERVVEWLVATLTPAFPGLCRVRLYETADAWVEWTAP